MSLPISSPRNLITDSARRFIDYRDGLQGEAKARVDRLMLHATEDVIRFGQQAEEECLLPTEMPEKVKKPGWQKQKKAHDKTTRRSMTLVEALERDKGQQDRRQQQTAALRPVDDDDDDDLDPLQNSPPSPTALPSSTAPPALLDSKKRARKHTTAYREAFGDSQNDPTAGIKRGKAGGLL